MDKPITEQDLIELEMKDANERIKLELNSINILIQELLRAKNPVNVFRLSNNLIRCITGLTSNKIYLIDLEKEVK